ncbi:MAG TPA: GreA/GreB family elongation factor [Candidatus Polarisedimenticolaceae bacterium]|nr:GreA/GreB family elongation factor [Candidatus Polarisedimenticolaceae bacterium]
MKEAKQRLEEELRQLERELRVELPQEIKKALAMGDLRENAEYHAALERQSYVRARIGQLRVRLTELGMINMANVPKDRAGLGSSLTVLDLDQEVEITWELVVPEVADLERGLISIASPIGRGLVGKCPGDEVVVDIPSGQRRFEVLELRTVHDKA